MRSLLSLFVVLFAFVATASEARRIVVLGDSIAAGYGLEPEEAFPAVLQDKIREASLNYTVVNAGVSGDTTAGGASRIGWILQKPLDVLVLELGGNDGLRGVPPEETERNLEKIIDKVRAKYPSAQILLAGMQMPENMGQDYVSDFREVFKRVAKKKDVALVPFLLEGVGGKAELNQPDRIHPTAEGQRIVAENVWKVLKPIISEAKPSSPPSNVGS